MRIAVITIAKDEENFINRWADSAKDADLLVIGDTGSNDRTVETAESLGIIVHAIRIRPWRFDQARNSLLALIPEDVDIIINLDADEILSPGWREKLESAPPAERYSYSYTWSWTKDNQPDINFNADKCHSRFGWIWKHPCHEALYPTEGTPRTVLTDFEIHHHPDPKKSRKGYLELLELAVKEAPSDDRMAHYYGRELYLQGDWTKARVELTRHLALPTAVWPAERAQSLRFIAKMDINPERWFWKAIAEDMNRRDAMVDLVDLYMKEGMKREAAGLASRALRIAKNPGDYMTTQHAYDDDYLKKVITGTGTVNFDIPPPRNTEDPSALPQNFVH